MLRRLFALAFVASTFTFSPSLLACGGSASPPESPSASASVRSLQERCAGTAEWSITARGSSLSRFEGKRVWLSAVERDRGVVVLREGRIANGAFTFACAKSLHTTYAYPTFAVVIDDDGDGRCSGDDVQSAVQLYGWNSDIDEVVDAKALRSVRTASTVVGDRKTFDFCALYFPRP